ncbi:Uncharacterised protein [Candidatus Gugararchaeum adminiculabundum]|nr:Uncharacterised protein [Candidatus Gugararchaeum adminiculabundum]
MAKQDEPDIMQQAVSLNRQFFAALSEGNLPGAEDLLKQVEIARVGIAKKMFEKTWLGIKGAKENGPEPDDHLFIKEMANARMQNMAEYFERNPSGTKLWDEKETWVSIKDVITHNLVELEKTEETFKGFQKIGEKEVEDFKKENGGKVAADATCVIILERTKKIVKMLGEAVETAKECFMTIREFEDLVFNTLNEDGKTVLDAAREKCNEAKRDAQNLDKVEHRTLDEYLNARNRNDGWECVASKIGSANGIRAREIAPAKETDNGKGLRVLGSTIGDQGAVNNLSKVGQTRSGIPITQGKR